MARQRKPRETWYRYHRNMTLEDVQFRDGHEVERSTDTMLVFNITNASGNPSTRSEAIRTPTWTWYPSREAVLKRWLQDRRTTRGRLTKRITQLAHELDAGAAVLRAWKEQALDTALTDAGLDPTTPEEE